MDLMKIMRTLLFLLAALLTGFWVSAQQTVNNFTVKTNLTVLGSASLTNVSIYGGMTYGLSDEPDLLFGQDYGIGLDVGLSSTTAKARIRSVSTIADLLTVDPLTSDIFSYVKVLGYSSAGDGGDGDFRRILSTGVTNAGSITKISAGNTNYAWSRIWDGTTVEAAWFGAFAGDGVDDSAAIQAAMDYVHSLGRGDVRLAGGRYDISTTLRVPYRVNVLGAPGWRIGENASSISTNQLFLNGGVTMLRLANNANVDIMWMDSTDGYIRQPSETLEDGEVVDSRFQDSRIENLIFFGNAANQTANNLRGLAAKCKWTVTVKNCAFVYIRGYPLWLFDVNAFVLDDIWSSQGGSIWGGRGSFVYSSADNFFGRLYFGGTRGPVIWGNTKSTFKNIFSDQLLFNAVNTNTLFTVSSWTTNTLATLASNAQVESGDPVELRTGGTLPTGFSDMQLYFAVKLATNVYGFHTNYALATNGTYLAGTGAASGTAYMTVGPATGLYLSGGAGQNVFSGLRSDQNSGPGIVLRGAVGNYISGLEAGENDGVANGETVAAEDKAGVIFDKDSASNEVHGTIYQQNIGFHVRSNATANVMSAVYTGVSTNVVNTSSGTNYKQVQQTLDAAVAVGSLVVSNTLTAGNSAAQTALALTGNASGVRVLTLERTSGLTQKVGLGVATDTLNIFNETDGRGIALIGDSTTTAFMQMGDSTAASPRTAEFFASGGSGTNVAGAAFLIYADRSTGNADQADAFKILTGDAGASGAALQGATTKFAVEGDGDVRLTAGITVHANGTKVSRIRHGRATLVAGSVVVSDAYVTTSTRILLSVYTTGGTVGHLNTGTRSAGVSFTITSSSGTDTSVVDWVAIEP
jgi:hypothetical protein